jgi:hypothetical protein
MRGVRWLVVSLLVMGSAQYGKGEVIYDQYACATPNGAWSYSFSVGVGKGKDPSYIPLLSDLRRTVSPGYVSYPDGGPSVPTAGWIHQDPAHYNEDTIRVFRTHLLSSMNVSIPVQLGGDDGHSLYVNGSFVGGGGCGVAVNSTIHLTAGVPTEVTLLGYNRTGPWQLVFRRQDGTAVSNTPGVTLKAAAPAPEPHPGSDLLIARVSG